jgi:hypothetical protein
VNPKPTPWRVAAQVTIRACPAAQLGGAALLALATSLARSFQLRKKPRTPRGRPAAARVAWGSRAEDILHPKRESCHLAKQPATRVSPRMLLERLRAPRRAVAGIGGPRGRASLSRQCRRKQRETRRKRDARREDSRWRRARAAGQYPGSKATGMRFAQAQDASTRGARKDTPRSKIGGAAGQLALGKGRHAQPQPGRMVASAQRVSRR